MYRWINNKQDLELQVQSYLILYQHFLLESDMLLFFSVHYNPKMQNLKKEKRREW